MVTGNKMHQKIYIQNDAPEMKMYMNIFFHYNFVFNLITFHVCPYRYICNYIYKYSGPLVYNVINEK